MGFVFDLLGDDFSEDELLGEILGADHDAVSARRAARRQEKQRGEGSGFRILPIVNTRIVSEARSRNQDNDVSFAPLVLDSAFQPTHGLRRGLYSCAAARLLYVHHAGPTFISGNKAVSAGPGASPATPGWCLQGWPGPRRESRPPESPDY